MAVTAAMIKELRGLSGAGMSACKSALVEADGNMDAAFDILRKRGAATAEKKAGRIAAEGLSLPYITEDGEVAVVVEVNSETDFVAKNQKFQDYVLDVAKQAASSKAADVDGLLTETWIGDSSKTVNEAHIEMISTIGEKLAIRRFERLVNDGSSLFVSYVHAGGKVAVLLEVTTDVKNDNVVEMGKNICMQIAAMSPKFVDRGEISEDFIAKEKAILIDQAKNDPKNANKPENIIEKMIIGRLNKEFKEMCLVDQEYVKDDKMSVGQYVASVAKAEGGSIALKKFIRYETGQGLEKKNEDFAAEVAKAMA
ncbi:MAG: translation elongation factor Ts [Clostridiales bacterium]|nr:translation elongation factor Ts [Clostridiales bacterium]